MKDQNLDVTTLDTQRYVALDLEYNQPSGAIIQVGVAIGSASKTTKSTSFDAGTCKSIPSICRKIQTKLT